MRFLDKLSGSQGKDAGQIGFSVHPHNPRHQESAEGSCMVVYRDAAGKGRYSQHRDSAAAFAFVQSLNRSEAENARVFKLAEIPFDVH